MNPLQTALDEETVSQLVELGGNPRQDEGSVPSILHDLQGNRFLRSRNPDLSFSWLEMLDWQSGFNLIKGLVMAENHRISNYGGSVSLVKFAFRVLENRDRIQAMEVAAWIVEHSSNDYIPFEMRKIRYAFEEIRRSAPSWPECRRMLDAWEAAEWQRQAASARAVNVQASRAAIVRAVKARCHAMHQQLSVARTVARERFLDDLSQLDVKSRLEHLAWDDRRDLSFYPGRFAAVDYETFRSVDAETQARLIGKLQGRPKGPWRELLQRIEENRVKDTNTMTPNQIDDHKP